MKGGAGEGGIFLKYRSYADNTVHGKIHVRLYCVRGGGGIEYAVKSSTGITHQLMKYHSSIMLVSSLILFQLFVIQVYIN